MNWGMKAQERQKGTEGTFVCDPQETGICRSPASHLVLGHQSATNTSPSTGSMQASLPQLDMTQSAGKAHAAGSCSCYRQPYSCQQEWTQPIRTAHTLFNKKKKDLNWQMECKAAAAMLSQPKPQGLSCNCTVLAMAQKWQLSFI